MEWFIEIECIKKLEKVWDGVAEWGILPYIELKSNRWEISDRTFENCSMKNFENLTVTSTIKE